MLRVFDLHRSFGAKHVLKGAGFQLPSSSIAGLIGPSGGGKSLLLKAIAGVARVTQGEVTFDGGPVGGRASLMFQEGALFDSLNVIDNVAFPLVSGRVPISLLRHPLRDEVQGKAQAMLERVGLGKASYKMPAQLSGGMRRRVSLARALVARPALVLLDDPTSGLDPVASSVIMDLIAELHREYLPTTLMVSHDLRRLFPVVDTVLALFDGRVIFKGSVDELRMFDSPELRHFVSCRYDLDAPQGSVTGGVPGAHA